MSARRWLDWLLRCVLATAAAGTTLAWAGAASAGDLPWQLEYEMRAPQGALELDLRALYTQPFGSLPQASSGDWVSAGFGAELACGYRFHPRWASAFYVQYHESAVSHDGLGDMDVRGVVAGIETTYYFYPFEDAVPYFVLGGGYRSLMMSSSVPAERHSYHGLQLSKLLVGIDLRIHDSVGLGPVAGADLDLLLWDANGGVAFAARPVVFVFGGLSGRFDLGGERVGRYRALHRMSAAQPR